MKTLKFYVTDYNKAVKAAFNATRLTVSLDAELRPLCLKMTSQELVFTKEFKAHELANDALELALQKRYTIAKEAVADYGFDTFYDAVELSNATNEA